MPRCARARNRVCARASTDAGVWCSNAAPVNARMHARVHRATASRRSTTRGPTLPTSPRAAAPLDACLSPPASHVRNRAAHRRGRGRASPILARLPSRPGRPLDAQHARAAAIILAGLPELARPVSVPSATLALGRSSMPAASQLSVTSYDRVAFPTAVVVSLVSAPTPSVRPRVASGSSAARGQSMRARADDALSTRVRTGEERGGEEQERGEGWRYRWRDPRGKGASLRSRGPCPRPCLTAASRSAARIRAEGRGGDGHTARPVPAPPIHPRGEGRAP